MHLLTSIQKIHFINEAKIELGIFIRSQIPKLFQDYKLNSILRGEEKLALEAFWFVLKNILGNFKASDYQENVGKLLKT